MLIDMQRNNPESLQYRIGDVTVTITAPPLSGDVLGPRRGAGAGAALVVYNRHPSDAGHQSPAWSALIRTPPPLNMKTFVAVCLLACAAAFPQDLDLIEGSGEPPVELAVRSFNSADIEDDNLLRSEFEMGDEGQFQYGYETRDGTAVEAAGENRQIGDGAGVVMRGAYSYTSPEGVEVTVRWEADEAGFRAFGPQVPEVPEHVTRLLKTLEAAQQPAVSAEVTVPPPSFVEA